MINEIARHSIRFMLLIFIQGLILKNVEAGMYINPFLYILFIMQLPFDIPAWLGMLLSFFTGMMVDIFYGTFGMHMAACTFVGFARPRILKLMSPRDGYEFGMTPTIQDMGKAWFLTYTGLITLLHHFILFNLEAFSLTEIFSTIIRVFVSSLATILLIVVTQFLLYRNKSGA